MSIPRQRAVTNTKVKYAMKIKLTGMFSLLLVVIISLCFATCSGTGNEISNSSTNELRIIDHTMNVHKFASEKGPQGKVTVSGQVQNRSDHTFTKATVYARFYDKDGNFIYQSSAEKENLPAGEVWYFTIEGSGPDIWKITKYDISTAVE
jgi:hypothetical protein